MLLKIRYFTPHFSGKILFGGSQWKTRTIDTSYDA